MITPAQKNLTIIRGSDFRETYRIRYMNPDGSPGDLVPLGGWSADATLFLPTGETLPFTVNLDAGLSTVTIRMEDAVTVTLPEQNCSWQLRMIEPGGDKLPYLLGFTNQSEGVLID